MEELLLFLKEQIILLGDYPVYMYFGIAIATLLLTQCIKVPFKKFISGKIKNDTIRKKVNLIFMVLPFGIAIGLNYAFSKWFGFNVYIGMSSGFLSEFLYEFIKTLFAKCKDKITDEDISEAVKEAKATAKETQSQVEEESRKLDMLLK